MFLFVLWHNERFIIDHSHPDWTNYFPVRWLLILHGLGGVTALLIGPWQLSSRFPEKARARASHYGTEVLVMVLCQDWRDVEETGRQEDGDERLPRIRRKRQIPAFRRQKKWRVSRYTR